MRYVKVLLLVLAFFLSMVFFFQNQESLSREMTLKLNLFFIPPMESIPLPFYFVVLAAFAVGGLIAFLALVWDKMHRSAKHMKTLWRVRALEKELDEIKSGARPYAPQRVSPLSPVTEHGKAVDDVAAPDPDKM